MDVGQKLFDAFSPIVKDSLRSKQFRSRDVDLAGEQRCVLTLNEQFIDVELTCAYLHVLCMCICSMQRCVACDGYFQEMHRYVHELNERVRYPSLQTKARVLERALTEFYSIG